MLMKKTTATHIILYTDFQGIVDGSVEEVGTEEKRKKRKRSVLKYKLKPPASKKESCTIHDKESVEELDQFHYSVPFILNVCCLSRSVSHNNGVPL